ncbi:3'-5' exonuclease [Aquitalea magnusonii]|uniref:Uncharacterized protein DUF5051 n=1 Tax=Aquitalea magnusonii TaxID=332411 RepID=A0A318JHV4_9NEIS|nr:3'-5' exonuclease [Aquitalea magnusonii]PXX49403.1 uncharacterized protein DUF5051 [Aquitalea magnusonii]
MKPTRHIIVDLETLDTQPSAVILTAGLVAVEITETECITLGSWYRPLLWDHPRHNQAGRSTSQDTADWWVKQSDAALSEAFCNDYDAIPISLALNSLNAWLQLNPYPIWGNGSDFDNAVLQHAFKQHGLRWPYWRNCCLRSTKNLANQLGLHVEMPEWPEGKIKHHALHDAEYEARILAALLRAFTEQNRIYVTIPAPIAKFEIADVAQLVNLIISEQRGAA